MPDTRVFLWHDGRPYTEAEYRAWARRVRGAVQAWDLRVRWVARQIERTPSHVSNVLNAWREGRQLGAGAETLARIEELLRRVEAGEVAPR